MKNINYEDETEILKSMEKLFLEDIKPSSILKNAPLSLKDKKEFMEKAIEIDGLSYIYLSNRLKKDKNLLIKALNKSDIVYLFIDKKYKRSPKVILTLFKTVGFFETLEWIHKGLSLWIIFFMMAVGIVLIFLKQYLIINSFTLLLIAITLYKEREIS